MIFLNEQPFMREWFWRALVKLQLKQGNQTRPSFPSLELEFHHLATQVQGNQSQTGLSSF